MKTFKLSRNECVKLLKVIEDSMEEISDAVTERHPFSYYTCNLITNRLHYYSIDKKRREQIREWYSEIFGFKAETVGVKLMDLKGEERIDRLEANALRLDVLAMFHAIVSRKMNKKACGF